MALHIIILSSVQRLLKFLIKRMKTQQRLILERHNKSSSMMFLSLYLNIGLMER